VADDGESNRALVQLVLTRAGLTVQAAENGQQAVELALAGGFDVVLMDMQMPVLDGYAATLRLRQAGYERPIVALTAHAMQGDEEKCRAAGCSGFLTKPISIDRLLATLAELVGVADEPLPGGSRRLDPRYSDSGTNDINSAAGKEAPLHSTLPTEDADFRDIVEKFHQRLGEKLREMRRACAARNYVELAAAAHWLKGCGGSAGFEAFTRPAQALELLARQGNSELASLVIDDLCRLAERIEMPWVHQATV
jgi:CheY-like chemotaxis protein/HPt (histidine-containing phosphotransfer) domain-containing protein